MDIHYFTHIIDMGNTEKSFQEKAARRREFRKKLEEGRDRRSDITGLIERFSL